MGMKKQPVLFVTEQAAWPTPFVAVNRKTKAMATRIAAIAHKLATAIASFVSRWKTCSGVLPGGRLPPCPKCFESAQWKTVPLFKRVLIECSTCPFETAMWAKRSEALDEWLAYVSETGCDF